ncbi:hypothetical protein NRB16_24570 [Pseudomonas sp. LJDD11]|uniref:hypothetical protein n=1 Tax=Pseudomonas sp. LJDD11 TaxID=2931984 RepID=UPI00211C2790|nr:hypothetical protein [Pseudomonas sp. LJDD11]MCQ9426699.1 hypothetical protein [Pseudomonas sp. LJDD11]
MNRVSILVRILLAGSEGKTASACWVDADQGCAGYGGMSRQERFEMDCEYRRYLHQHLVPRYWDALIARYTLDAAERGQAIKRLGKVIASHAHPHFKFYAVLTWAEPQKPGQQGKRSSAILQADIYDMNRWDNNQGTPERTRRYWRSRIHEALNGVLDEAITAALGLLERQELFEPMAA